MLFFLSTNVPTIVKGDGACPARWARWIKNELLSQIQLDSRLIEQLCPVASRLYVSITLMLLFLFFIFDSEIF